MLRIVSIIFSWLLIVPAHAQSVISSFPPGIFHNRAALGAGAWTPAQLPGLIAWYKADVGVFTDTGCSTPAANTNTVACWTDQSGHGYNLIESVSTHRPTYLTAGLNSKPTLNFSTALASNMVTATGVAMGTGTSGTIYGIGTLTSTSVSFALFAEYSPPTGAGNGSGFMGVFENSTLTQIAAEKGTTAGSAAISLSTETRWGGVADGANVTAIVNGVLGTPVAGSASFVSAGCIAIGGAIGSGCTLSGASLWNGVMSEIIFTNQAISAPDLALLDAYLAARW